MFLLNTLATVVGACILTGCTVGPDYYRPVVPIAQHYQAQPALQQPPASVPDSFSIWWESFGAPLLSQYVSDARVQNLKLARAFARMTQAHAGLGAANAALLPSGNTSGQAARIY